MTSTIDTLGKAVRHALIVRVQCTCGRRRDFEASDLMMRFGGGRDPQSLKFKCRACKPTTTVTLLEAAKQNAGRTLADVVAEDAELSVWCEGMQCSHGGKVDLAALVARLGPDHGAMHDDLFRLFSCSKCGSRKVSIRYHVKTDRGHPPGVGWTLPP